MSRVLSNWKLSQGRPKSSYKTKMAADRRPFALLKVLLVCVRGLNKGSVEETNAGSIVSKYVTYSIT